MHLTYADVALIEFFMQMLSAT